MPDPAKTRATIADLLAIPEERRRHEIIDGVLVEKEAASGRHGGAQVKVVEIIGPYNRRPGGRWPGLEVRDRGRDRARNTSGGPPGRGRLAT